MKRKQTNFYPQLVIGLGAAAYFFVLLSDPVLAADMWTKAEDIMKDVYGKIFFIIYSNIFNSNIRKILFPKFQRSKTSITIRQTYSHFFHVKTPSSNFFQIIQTIFSLVLHFHIICYIPFHRLASLYYAF